MESRTRKATIEDAETISALILPLAERYIAHELSEAGRRRPLDSRRPTAIMSYFKQGDRYHVCEIDGTIVGVVATRENRQLYHLFVADAARGQGVARRLWQVAKEACLATGWPEFTVNSSRYAAAMYEKFGFVRQGEEQERDGVTYIPMEMPADIA